MAAISANNRFYCFSLETVQPFPAFRSHKSLIYFIYKIIFLVIYKKLRILRAMSKQPTPSEVACKLAVLYDQPFGGKPGGRYRVSPKNLRRLMQRRRISDDFVRLLAEEMFELGYVFIDMETYYVVANARTFSNYRRLADAMIEDEEKNK